MTSQTFIEPSADSLPVEFSDVLPGGGDLLPSPSPAAAGPFIPASTHGGCEAMSLNAARRIMADMPDHDDWTILRACLVILNDDRAMPDELGDANEFVKRGMPEDDNV